MEIYTATIFLITIMMIKTVIVIYYKNTVNIFYKEFY